MIACLRVIESQRAKNLATQFGIAAARQVRGCLQVMGRLCAIGQRTVRHADGEVRGGVDCGSAFTLEELLGPS